MGNANADCGRTAIESESILMTLGTLFWIAAMIGGPVKEQTCLAATIYLEARDQSTRGQLAVAEVALRRVEQGRWGDSVCEVVKARRQFAPTLVPATTTLDQPEAWEMAWELAGQSIRAWQRPAAERPQIVPGADHFYAHNVVRNRPEWADSVPVAVIGDHTFVRVAL